MKSRLVLLIIGLCSIIFILWVFNQNTSGWLDFYGNIIGAAVGAFGAYLVTTYQLKKEREERKYEQEIKNKKYRPIFKISVEEYMNNYGSLDVSKDIEQGTYKKSLKKYPKAYYSNKSERYIAILRKITENKKKKDSNQIIIYKAQNYDLTYPGTIPYEHRLLTLKNMSEFEVSFVLIEIESKYGLVKFSINRLLSNEKIGLLLPFDFSDQDIEQRPYDLNQYLMTNYSFVNKMSVYCQTVSGEEIRIDFDNEAGQLNKVSVEKEDYIEDNYNFINNNSKVLPNFKYEIEYNFLFAKMLN